MIRLASLWLTVLTGFTGLVYEVAWQKYLATLLGSHSEATAAVLAIFLGGLAAGYAIFGRATRRLVERAGRESRPPRLLLVYALLEGGIGLWALAFPLLFSGAQSLSLWVPLGNEGFSFAFDVLLSALLIGPPTVLMGGTIPFLTLALAGDVERATRVHAWVYGCNTAGAFAGALAGGFWLVPWLGLDGVLTWMGCSNLVAAALFAQLDRGAATPTPDLAGSEEVAAPAHFIAWAGVALLAGFAMMALQTTLNRVGALALGASQFTFAMVVAVFVACIALGSLAVSAVPRIPRGLLVGSQWLLLLLLFPLYLALPDSPYWAHTIRVLFRQVDPAFWAYYLALFCGALAVLAVPIGLSGALLPLLFHALRRDARDLGAVAGRLYAWNTVGSLLGALLGGYLLLFWLDLHQVFRIAMSAVAMGASLLTLLVLRPRPRAMPVALLVPVLAAVWMLPAWSGERLSSGVFRARRPSPVSFEGPDAFFRVRKRSELIFYEDDPTSTVSVLESDGEPRSRSILVNGKSDGSLDSDYPTMALTALVPALLAERHESCFVIGLGTGVTTGEFAALDETRRVRVAEISRGVIAAAPLFDVGNLEASKNPKVEVRRGDAYRLLLQSPDLYDVIASEPSNPWVTGVEMLYSREFLEAARSRLAPGGVYGQWFHLYETDDEVVELVLRTYASVFEHVAVWFALGPDLLLLGFDRPQHALDVGALEQRFRRADFAAGFERVGITSFPQLLAHELLPMGTLHATPLEGPTHSLRHPILSYRAARAFFRGQPASLPPYAGEEQQRVALRNSLLRRHSGGHALSEEVLETAARESCRFNRREECATLLAYWDFEHPGSARLPQVVAELRQSRGGRRAQLAPAALERLGRLFGSRLPEVNGKMALRRAEQLTGQFLRFYHHAAPFNRALLETAWSRCRGERCEERRREVEQQLGRIRAGSFDPAADDPATLPETEATPTAGRRAPAWERSR